MSAFGVAQVALAGIPALRRQPGPPVREPVPFSLLKNSDEQTVVGLAAVLHAIHDFGLREQAFDGWGVVGSPRFPGRLVVCEQIHAFRAEGALGVSPHIISHRSTHSLSGTISLALKMRGTNYGVGGGDGALVEGLLTALTLLDAGQLPGLWAVLAEWDPEPVPGGSGPTADEAICHAVALALVPSRPTGLCLRLRPLLSPTQTETSQPTVADLAAFLRGERGASWTCPLDWGARLELEQVRTPELVEVES